jgi:hypothetical protein
MTAVWSHHFFVVTYGHEKKKWDIKNYGSTVIAMDKHLPRITVKLYHIMLYRVLLAWAEFELTTLVVIYTDETDRRDITDI